MSDYIGGSEGLCLTCPLPSCDERDPGCAFHKPVKITREQRQANQRKYDQSAHGKARRRAYMKARRAAGLVPNPPAEKRRDYWREYKRRKAKAEQKETNV